MDNIIRSACFNQGADARILGKPERSNPYRPGPCAAAWRHGHRHANRLWACRAGSWDYRALPHLQGSGTKRLRFARVRYRGYASPEVAPLLPPATEEEIRRQQDRVWAEMPEAERMSYERGQRMGEQIRRRA